jgi:predicted Zn-dependent protease
MTRNTVRLVAVVVAGIALLNAVWLLKSKQAETLIAVSALPQNAKAREDILLRNIKLLDRAGWVRARGHADQYRALADMRRTQRDHRAESQLRLTALQVGPSTLDDRVDAARALVDTGEKSSSKMAAALLQDAAVFSTPATIGIISKAAEDLKLPMTFGRDPVPAFSGELLVIALGSVDSGIAGRVAESVGQSFGAYARIERVPGFDAGAADRFHAGHVQYDVARLTAAISERFASRIGDKRYAAVLVLTDKDIYAANLNFLWATGSDGYSLISTVRLADAEPSITAARIAKQAITSMLDRLDIPRASHPQCANANAISVAEMDQKTTLLCAETRVQLEARLSQKPGAAAAR